MAGDAGRRAGAFTRRGGLRAALGAAGALAAGSALAACGTSLATLSAAATKTITLTWRPWYGFPTDPNITADMLQALMYEAIQDWLQGQSGVDVHVLGDGTSADTMSSMLAGTGPDVFHDVNLPLYLQGGLVLDLAPYANRERLDLSVYPQGQLDYVRAVGASQAGGGLFALPATVRTLAMAVYEGALDDLGLTYPEPTWTHTDWAQLWQATSARSPALPRLGGAFEWSGYDGAGGGPAAFYLKGFGGEYVDPAASTRCALPDAAAQAALQWCYGLVLQGACSGATGLSVPEQVEFGQLVSGPLGTMGDLYNAARSWNTLKWNLYPMPVWPKGPLTFASSDFYAVWSGSRAPDLAWSLVRYLCAGTDWQTKMMEMAMAGPNQKALWTTWKALVVEYAPPLKSINLDVYLNAVQNDELYVGLPFRYGEAQVAAILTAFGQAVQSGQASVAAAAAAAAQQIDALQAAGAGRQQAAQAALQQLQSIAAAPSAGASPGGVTVGGGGSP